MRGVAARAEENRGRFLLEALPVQPGILFGLPFGWPKGPGRSRLDPFRPEIEALLANGSTQKFIAKRYGTTPGNLANWMRKNGIRKPEA